jgi:oligosaccharide repeat unit polymerase
MPTTTTHPGENGGARTIQPLQRSIWIHPLMIFGFAWGLTVYLYDLHLSALLIYPTDLVLTVAAWVVIPFCFCVLIYLGLSWDTRPRLVLERVQFVLGGPLERKLKIAFWIWAALTVIEIIVSGGVPILWLFQGSAKTYADFGISSVHGLLNSLLIAIAVIHFALYALKGKKRNLIVPTFVLVWSIIAVTRNLMIVVLLEYALVWAMIRGIAWKTVGKVFVSLLALILVFGYIGDARTGGDTFRELAQPSQDYPEWLPSGVLWVYIYVSTPINNLVNTVQNTTPLDNVLFPNATSLLFPTVVREVLYNPTSLSDAVSGDLVTEAFNVSTAFVGPFQDFGMAGITLFSILLALVSMHYWRNLSLLGSLTYAVLAQCLAISVFFNHLFYLPVITQVLWFYFFLRENRRKARKSVA